MNPIKLTLLFCFLTTILFGQGEVPGYIIIEKGDTLRGRIMLTPDLVKFKQEGVKTKYKREDLLDYGYYANRVFFPKPDEATPAKESNRMGTVILVTGDTLQNFHIHTIRPNVVIGYFEYPQYIVYYSKVGELQELITHEDVGNISYDLIEMNDFPKKEEVFPMYAERVLSKKLRAYNVDYRYPCNVEYRYETFESKLVKNIAPLTTEVFKKRIAEPYYFYRKGQPYSWVIKKDKETYSIRSAREWKKAFEVIFGSDVGFTDFLKEKNVRTTNIRGVMEAYGDFAS